MKIIAILSQKGGAGKSTLARAFAVAGLMDGQRTAIIDADPQGTVAGWAKRRQAKAPTVATLDGRTLIDVLADIRTKGAQLAIIDTPPHVKPLVSLAVTEADAVAVPVRPSPDDLAAVGGTLAIVRESGKPAGIIINHAPAKSLALTMARTALATFGLPIAPVALVERMAHQYAAAEGLTALEREPDGKAATEINVVWQWFKSNIIR
jgi:chromosome partitioning protein